MTTQQYKAAYKKLREFIEVGYETREQRGHLTGWEKELKEIVESFRKFSGNREAVICLTKNGQTVIK